MPKLKIGVIGTGNLGQHHARVLTELPQAELAGVADIDEPRAREIGERHRVPFFRDYRDLLGRCQAVTIVVPTTLHHQIAREALEAGLQVLVEKPIAATAAQAEELISLSQKKKLKLQVGHIERFNPALLAAAGHIHDPKFIECLRISPFGGRNTDVPVVLDLMIHDIDIVLKLFQSEIERVSAIGSGLISGQIDIANARLEFSNGCVANLTASRISEKKERRMRIFQRDAYISLDYLTPGAVVHRLKGDPKGVLDPTKMMGIFEPKIEKVEQLKAELAAFADAVINDTEPVVTGNDGLRALKVAEAIVAEIRQRGALIGA